MRPSALRRAITATFALSLVTAAAAVADTVGRDADTLTPGSQASRDLGAVAPNAVVDVPIIVTLGCAGLQHVDRGQSLLVEIWTATVPPGGAIAMDPVTIGPVPGSWPVDGEGCSGSEASLSADASVTITAPGDLGPAEYSILLERTSTPAGSNDGSAIGGMTGLTFTLVVEEPTPGGDPPGDDPPPPPGDDPPGDDPPNDDPPSAPDPPVAEFGQPAGSGELSGRVGRTIPVKVHLMAGDVVVDTGSLVLDVSRCEGGDPVTTVDMEWRADSGRWFGLLRTAGLAAGCYRMSAMHDGWDAGSVEFHLFDQGSSSTTSTPAPAAKGARGR